MRLRFNSMTVGLAVGITAAVVVACATGAFLYLEHHFGTLLDTTRSTALAEGELIRVALEHQMMENDRTLIGSMIESFGHQPRVEHVALLDRHGVQRFASGPRDLGDELRIDSPTCQACHRYPPAERGTTRVIDSRGGSILRTVVPIRNREACHVCHDPAHEINGILIVDYDAGEIRAGMTRDLRWMVGGSAAMALLLVGGIAWVIRVVVLRRLQRFETTARLIAAGDLNRRVPAEGSDTVAWLAREFNTMADSVTGLLSEVRSQRERLETVINSIDDGIVVLDDRRNVIAANDAFLRRRGDTRESLVGCCCAEMPPESCGVPDCPTQVCLASGQRQVRICERRRADGSVAWEEVHASPVLDEAGNLVQVVEVWRDISERRTAEARLAESHRLASLGVLASGFSHELNTPLATVLTCVEGILRDARREQNGSEEWQRVGETASIAREQVLRCRGITQHFLRISRGQQSSGEIVDLGPAIAAASRLVEPTARAHSVKVRIEGDASGIRARADEAELQHSLINLMLNAIQACRPGGTVSICAEGGEPTRIRVSDDGCGIPAEFQKRVFEPFFSLRKGGTGLGLFLSLNFVRRWGGDIVLSSAAGRGSSFEIVLPSLSGPSSPAFRRMLQLVDRVAASDSTVLITGETGAGKERVAKLLHARSGRRSRPFVVVECAALQDSLLQSELFGHERGSFTGAERAKPGLFEVAHGGTIFLDEIGEVSPTTQVKLLRVLDTSTFRHVGGTSEIHVDVRVLAATNRELPAMVRQGQFREDLYYRLCTISIEVPSLRSRGSDIDLLANHFVGVLNERFESSKRLSAQALELLRGHTWPGNVRELLHVVESAMVVCEGDEIRPEHLPAPFRGPGSGHRPAAGLAAEGPLPTLEEVERQHILLALRVEGGHRGRAAKSLGISERNLYRKLRDYGLMS